MIDFSPIMGLLDEGCIVTFESGEEMNEFVAAYKEIVDKNLKRYLSIADFIHVFKNEHCGLQPSIRHGELWICDKQRIQRYQDRGVMIIPYSDLTHFTELLESELPFQSLL